MTRKAPVVRYLIATGALVLSSGAMAGQPLFLGQATAPSRATQTTAATLANKPTTFGMRVMRANPNVVSKANREIELDLGMRRVNLVLDKASDTATGSLVWAGHVLETSKARSMSARETRTDDANSGILVRRGNGVTGNVRVDGQLYRIRPLPDGSHAVIEVNENQMPPEHPAGYSDNNLPHFRMDRPASTVGTGGVTAMAIDPGATATIRVQVVATNQAVTAYGGDMQALAELAVAETNQGYANSNVGINMQLANYTTVAYTSAGDGHYTDRDRFVGKTDGYMDGIHTTRDANAADVNVLIIDDGGNCGLAAAIGANAATSFATVHWDCATGYYSFGHEIGHLLSARHDPAADPTNTPYAYGHGYRSPSNTWRTIMAYNCTAGCPRLNYWSNPDVTYGGVAMGTTTSNHNQRVLVNTKATMAAFRGTTPPRTTYSNGTDYTISDNTTVDSPITVSGRTGSAPSDTAIAVTILHTYKGDLKVDLVAPDGSLYNIHNRTGSSTDNVTGTFVKNLSTEAINGTWKLRVNDNAGGDVGKIDSWSITF